MCFFGNFNQRIKKFTFLDLKSIEIATFCFTVLLIKFAPKIIVIRKEWFITIMVLALIRPIYVFFFKK